MSFYQVDRNKDYMKKMWGTTQLITDYNAISNHKKLIQEVMYDKSPNYDLKKQSDLHEIIRNDEDYDDWEYGTEPAYGKKW
jgi:hypothetical protein